MDNLYAAVIHDVKNQLAELALRLERRGDCGEETGIALAASRRLTGLLLEQRREAGNLRVNVDSASPADVLEELAAEYRVLFPALEVGADAAAAPPFWFYDAALVRLALANAVHNACRHARSAVRLTALSAAGQLAFEVADDGPGFPPEMLASLPDTPSAASRSGTGLGLYLARKIAELHEMDGRCGSVALRNEEGARFRLELP